jgi:hypothetical protein
LAPQSVTFGVVWCGNTTSHPIFSQFSKIKILIWCGGAQIQPCAPAPQCKRITPPPHVTTQSLNEAWPSPICPLLVVMGGNTTVLHSRAWYGLTRGIGCGVGKTWEGQAAKWWGLAPMHPHTASTMGWPRVAIFSSTKPYTAPPRCQNLTKPCQIRPRFPKILFFCRAQPPNPWPMPLGGVNGDC